jgi:hypothetical protein
MAAPTSEAWAYLTKHLPDIRKIVQEYLPITRMEIPNTRVTMPDGQPIFREDSGEAQRDSVFLPKVYTIEDFDHAIQSKDIEALNAIMNDVWARAPESTDVYRIPGFCEMCNLLDGTVRGFLEDDPVT